jgi:glycosyltransferase involved in cell wall biosynthesis
MSTSPRHHPSISVVMPAYNAGRYIAEALSSVLAQEYRPQEIIVVDDGSTDDTAAVAAAIEGVRCFPIPHGGIGAARNAGVEAATGELLAFLDADDRWPPDKLARQVLALADEPAVDMVFGHVSQFHSPELDADQRERLQCITEPQPGLLAGAMLVRAAAYRRVGGFNTTLAVGEFVDWHARAMDAGLRECMLPQVMLFRRVHGSNTVIQQSDRKSDYLRVVKAALDRRRSQTGRSQ